MDSFEKPRTDLYRLSCHFWSFLKAKLFFDCEATVKPASKCKIAFFLALSPLLLLFNTFVMSLVRYSAKDKLFRWRNLLCTSHATAPWM